MWGIFRQHHYLSADFNKAADVYLIYWDDTLIGLRGVLTYPNGAIKYGYRGHRLVILPDYQGLGIGTKVYDFIAKMYVDKGLKFYGRSTHIRLFRHWSNSKEYVETARSNNAVKTNDQSHKFKNMVLNRVAYSFEYVGSDYYNKPHKTIVVDDGDVITKDELLKLKEDYYLTVVTGKPKVDNETELLCKELGIRTELLYRNVKGSLVRRKL